MISNVGFAAAVNTYIVTIFAVDTDLTRRTIQRI